MAEGEQQWLDLLLTDSLNRPLANAAYTLHAGTRAWQHNIIREGKLDATGRLAVPWRAEGLTLSICYRSLVFTISPDEPLERRRNQLTCLGFDTGRPDITADPQRVDAALEALRACALHDSASDRNVECSSLTREALLAAWYAGEIGVAPPPEPAPLRRRRLRKLRQRARLRMGLPAGTEPHPSAPSGSHLHLTDDLKAMVHTVWLAITTGTRGSRQSKNRIVVYDWFTGYGCPPCAGNRIQVLIDGEQAWGHTARDIANTKHELLVTTWSAQPDSELTRPEELAHCNPKLRRPHTFASYVEQLAARGGRTCILLWNWLGTPIVNPVLRRWALDAGDNVEVLQHAHPQIIGSFHQKTMVMDRTVAYCGGFNLRENDWDTQEHRIDDPRRNPHRLHGGDRDKPLPSFPPRHDLTLRIEGPLVDDVHDNFAGYWNDTLRSERKGLSSVPGRLLARINGVGPTSRVSPNTQHRVGSGPMIAQLVRTDPLRLPRHQAGYDILLRAIHNAHNYIYIENQFFRSAPIADAICASLRKHPKLQVIVVSNPVEGPLRFAYGAAYYTHLAQQKLRALRRDFTMYQLLSRGVVEGAVAYRPIEIHAKVMVVDDKWATVGSANLNERSIRFEAEANVAIEDRRFAKELRCRLMAEHMNLDDGDPRLEDYRVAIRLWRERANQNLAARERGELADGLAHPFEQAPSVKLLRGRSVWF